MSDILQRLRDAEQLFAAYEITGHELARVRALREKLENSQMTVSVIGQFKRGKSALVNRILGDKILPVGIVPVTAVVTSVQYGEKSAEVHFANGLVQPVAFDEISTFINEQENMDNYLNVTRVCIHCPAGFLREGITLVDTPGVGSLHEKNSEEAYAFVKESDAVIFTLSVDSPINQIEIEFLRNAKEYAAKFYFAVNKIDVIEEDELEAYLAYCRKFIAKLMEVPEVQMFPVSAKQGLGVEELTAAVSRDCRSQGQAILEESSALKLHDIVLSALAQISLYRKALSLPAAEFDKRFAQMKKFFAALQEQTAAIPAPERKNRVVAEAHLNDVKNRLTAKVSELFGIDYHYDIEEVETGKKVEGGTEAQAEAADAQAAKAAAGMPKSDDLTQQVMALCETLNATLNTIFMHREENSYKVARRINDLNRLVRRLVKMRDEA